MRALEAPSANWAKFSYLGDESYRKPIYKKGVEISWVWERIVKKAARVIRLLFDLALGFNAFQNAFEIPFKDASKLVVFRLGKSSDLWQSRNRRQ